MAINPDINTLASDVNALFTAPCSIMSDWTAVGEANYLAVQDAAVITNPGVQIEDPSRQVVARDNRMGALLGIRMRYSAEVTDITSPIVKVFGRTRARDGTVGNWQILKNRLGDLAVPLVVASTDLFSEAEDVRWTTADPFAHYFDSQGCSEFLVGVETAFDGDGTIDVAGLEAKIL